MDLGTRISQARQACSLTQKQVAEALRVSVQAVSLWETGKTFPKGERLRRLAKLLRTSPGWLSGIDDAPPDPDREGETRVVISVPLLSLSKALPYLLAKSNEKETFIEGWVVPTFDALGEMFSVRLKRGDKRPAGYDDGEILIFATGVIAGEGELVFRLVLNDVTHLETVEDEMKTRYTYNVKFSAEIDIASYFDKGRKRLDVTSIVSRGGINDSESNIVGVLVERRLFRVAQPPLADEEEDA